MPKFALYSKDITPTLSPSTASPKPATLIEWTQDPLFGNYEENDAAAGRGSVSKTLSGAVVQDFGVIHAGTEILISENDALTSDVIYELKRAESVVDAKYYFTDGYGIWEVQFSRTKSLKATHNLLFAWNSFHIWSYELTLIVVSVVLESFTETMTGTTTTTTTTSTSTTTSTTTTTAP